MNNKICVLMATYNGEKYLTEQIESVLQQKNVDVCLLVRDDGSTDRTLEILKSYKEEKKLDWYQGKHLNAAYGFWELMSKAPEAKYYAFCDQDDVWDEDKLYLAVTELEKAHDDFCLYACGTRLVDSKLNVIEDHKLDIKRTKYARLIFAHIPGNVMVFSNELRKKVMDYMPQNIGMHDSWLYKYCVAVGAEIILDEKPHISYRQHERNVVGMEVGLKKKIQKFIKLLNDDKIYPQLMEIKKVYYDNLDKSSREILDKLEKGKKSFLTRISLAFDKRIDFNNAMFNLVFKLKVILWKF